jgi:plastocyanin domain-containing protein
MARTLLLAVARIAAALTLIGSGLTVGTAVVPVRTLADSAQRRVDIKVTDAGFEPRQVKAKVGEPLTLAFTRTTDLTCITAIDIPDEDVKEFALPLDRTVTLTITPKKKGTERFHCSAMGMGNGRIVVE